VSVPPDQFAADLLNQVWGLVQQSMRHIDEAADEADAQGLTLSEAQIGPIMITVRLTAEQFTRVRRAARLAAKGTESWVMALLLGEAELTG